MSNKRGQVLRDVADMIDEGIKNQNYGHPHNDYRCVTNMFNAYLQKKHGPNHTPLDPVDGIIFMTLVKISRLASSPNHEDNWADLAGYAGCGVDVAAVEREKERDRIVLETEE
jgi:hypothetical protein